MPGCRCRLPWLECRNTAWASPFCPNFRGSRTLGPSLPQASLLLSIESAQQGVASLGHLPQSLPLAARVLGGNHSDVAAYLVAMGEARRIAEKHLGGKGRYRPPRMREQPACLGPAFDLFFYLAVELLDSLLQLCLQAQQFAPPLTGVGGQR